MKPKSFNLAYIDTKEEIINVLNNAGLPIVAMQCILKDVKETVDINTEQIIKKERGD